MLVAAFERSTDRARRVLVLAQEEARLLSHNFIGTEHLLLGLIHEGEGVAAQVLASLGINLVAVRDRVAESSGPAAEPDHGIPAVHAPSQEGAGAIVAPGFAAWAQLHRH
jgi:ATP-dependent Clp protease ATP-binding subunit ClpC